MSNERKARKAVIVGAGPVGCLAALALAKEGWQVEIYEARPDPRLPSSKANASLRSINLAISSRGITALRVIHPSAADRFLADAIPMRGRMIHDHNGRQQSQSYDRDGQCINSIDRGLLNEGLLDEVTAAKSIRVFFTYKLTLADLDRRFLCFSNADSGTDVRVTFDFCIGADGSYSNVRRQLMRFVRMDYQQTYIPHEYIELKMVPGKGPEGKPAFALDPNHLHIWPRHSFMLIALPNKDRSFTCTLFAPSAEFAQLKEPSKALTWFESHFPDALSLIGEQGVLDAFRYNPRSPLIAIKANPYHYKDRVIILGDAAHSMVPFFGQGLNCGLEDVRVLSVIMQEEGVDASDLSSASEERVDAKLERALTRYSESRHSDLLAINDLAMVNYVEMRHSVATPSYLFLRALNNAFSFLTSRWQLAPPSVESLLSRVPFSSETPQGWIPLYTMVTFRPDISYGVAKRKAEHQSGIIRCLGWCGTGIGVIGLALASLRIYRRIEQE